ncbi:MAG: porin family protein [Candidatus Thiothrix singaporensis]|uniref:Porin family protein n=1 Tax=Candidatus Thiothrix singaporensis TaxID=2799669 RepID=A0A7L6AUB0_9GAMM|nr:MAG: porin family protein [Candidatus Thiothrix singaporensis]
MNVNKYSIALSLPVLALSSSVWAGGVADQGVYAGLGVGSGKPKISAVAPNTLSSDSSTVFDGLVGYKFNKNLAIEGQYGGLGKVKTAAGGNAKADAASLSVVGMEPVGDKFGLYGKLGYADAKTKTSDFGANTKTISTRWLACGWGGYGVATKDALTGAKDNAHDNVASLNAVFNF